MYFGKTKLEFHTRWYQHKRNFKLEEEQGTAPSPKVHELKKDRRKFHVETNIIREAQVYKEGDSSCDLCVVSNGKALHCPKP